MCKQFLVLNFEISSRGEEKVNGWYFGLSTASDQFLSIPVNRHLKKKNHLFWKQEVSIG